MNLLLFFAIPVATIILSIVWQRIVRSPLLVAATAFAIFLIVVYAIDPNLLIYAIIYTILAYLAATISQFICDHIGNNGLFSNIRIKNIDATNINTNNLDSDNIETNTLSVNDKNSNENGNNCNRNYNNYSNSCYYYDRNRQYYNSNNYRR